MTLRALPLLALLLLAVSSCGAGGSAAYQLGHLDVRVSSADGSDVADSDLRLATTEAGEGYMVSLSSSAEAAESALVELTFDPGYVVEGAVRSCPAGQLTLLVSDKPGMLAFGVVMEPGQTLAPGELLRFVLRPATATDRLAAAAPVADYGKVTDFTLSDEAGVVTASWGYRSRGDYDQNSEVNISDLTPLGSRLGAVTNDGDLDEYDSVLDGDGNGEVNVSDLTPIGQNYQARISDYMLMHADGADLETAVSAQAGLIDFSASTMAPQTRRRFSTTIDPGALVSGHYYYVIPIDSADDTSAAFSNGALYEAQVTVKFEIPPAGKHTPDSAASQGPSMVLMPAIEGVAQAGAPVIAYTVIGGGGISTLNIAYHSAGAWHTEQPLGNHNYSSASALWLEDTGQGSPGGLVIAYDIEGTKVVALTFDEQWQYVGGADVGSANGVFSSLAVDVDTENEIGNIGVVHSYTGAGGVEVHFSELSAGVWNQQPVYLGAQTGAITLDCDFQYSSTVDPWIVFTHGTINTDSTLQFDFVLEQARRSGGVWTTSPVAYPDSPVFLDLGFDESAVPKLALVAARDFTVPLVNPPITISGYYDVAVGTHDGNNWTFETPFESELGFGIDGFPPTGITLELDLATDVEWCRPGAFAYSSAAGEIALDIESMLPTGGALSTAAAIMVDGGSGFQSSALYGGDPGRDFSWQERGAALCCSYIRSGNLDSEDVLAGNFNLAGELSYWSQP
jgi:hypothetical protein